MSSNINCAWTVENFFSFHWVAKRNNFLFLAFQTGWRLYASLRARSKKEVKDFSGDSRNGKFSDHFENEKQETEHKSIPNSSLKYKTK